MGERAIGGEGEGGRAESAVRRAIAVGFCDEGVFGTHRPAKPLERDKAEERAEKIGKHLARKE